LADALAETARLAPVRQNKRYIQERKRHRETDGSEARWEEALFWQDLPAGSYAPWKRLLTYQVNLPNSKHKDRGETDRHWGEIDLLAVSRKDLPVVIELKAPGSSESPADMLVQATAYAIALQKAWPKCLRAEWAKEIRVDVSELPATLSTCEIVCAAPKEYWDKWTGDTPTARSIKPEVWTAIGDLRKALGRRGYPSTFVRVNHGGSTKKPTDLSLSEERLPER
jgi:hypothetical protein